MFAGHHPGCRIETKLAVTPCWSGAVKPLEPGGVVYAIDIICQMLLSGKTLPKLEKNSGINHLEASRRIANIKRLRDGRAGLCQAYGSGTRKLA